MSLGTAGLTAGLSIKALEDYANQKLEGLKSIVTGSTGGVGSIAVMLLSKLGSEVTAVTGKEASFPVTAVTSDPSLDKSITAIEPTPPVEPVTIDLRPSNF